MTPDQPPTPDPSGDAELHRSLDDLGRRIGEAQAAAEARKGAVAPRRFPVAGLVAALLVAVVVVGLIVAGTGGDDDGEVAAGRATTTVPTTDPSAGGGDGSAATGDDPATTALGDAAPTTTASPTTEPPTTVTTDAPTTTEAPTTTAAPTTTTTTPPAPTPPPAADDDPPTGEPAQPSAGAAEVTVAAGDSFWRIAEHTVSEQLGRPATDAEITGYWAAFVAENADRLVEAGNPDLILPGQVLTLPAGTG